MRKSSYMGPKMSRYQFEGLQNKGWIIEYATEVYRRRPNIVARLELDLDNRFQEVVVKCFGWREARGPFLSPFTESKAEHVWKMSRRFIDLNIPVPKPVAMYTERQMGFVNHNVYLSEYIGKHQTGAGIIHNEQVPFSKKREFVLKVARIIAAVHHAGYLHHDLALDNFLMLEDHSNEIFLIDLTRVENRHRLSLQERVEDFARLNLCDCDLKQDHDECLWLHFLLRYDAAHAETFIAPLKKSLQKYQLRGKSDQ